MTKHGETVQARCYSSQPIRAVEVGAFQPGNFSTISHIGGVSEEPMATEVLRNMLWDDVSATRVRGGLTLAVTPQIPSKSRPENDIENDETEGSPH